MVHLLRSATVSKIEKDFAAVGVFHDREIELPQIGKKEFLVEACYSKLDFRKPLDAQKFLTIY